MPSPSSSHASIATVTNNSFKRTCNNDQDDDDNNNKKPRLKSPLKDKDGILCLFQIPGDLLPKIASCILPIDAYHLGQTCKSFHTSRDSKFLKPKSIAQRLLNASLVSSLDAVLKFNDAGFNVGKFRELHATLKSHGFPEGSILISGSIMVQAVLGKAFGKKTDVDLYVSEKAAPIVRTWLTSIEGANLLFGGVKTSSLYDGQCDLRRFMKTDNSEISHVEEYCKVPKNADEPVFLSHCYSRSKGNRKAWWRKVDETEGAVIKLYDNQKARHVFINVTSLPGTKLRQYKHYLRDVDTDTPDPCESDSEKYLPLHCLQRSPHKIDLILARREFTPEDVIGQFDLGICKASFNGRSFCVPDASNTFKSQPSMKAKGTCIHKPATLITRNFEIRHQTNQFRKHNS